MKDEIWCPLSNRPCNSSCILLSSNTDRGIVIQEDSGSWPVSTKFGIVGIKRQEGSLTCLMRDFLITPDSKTRKFNL